MNGDVRTPLEQAVSSLLDYLAVTDEPAPADIIWGLGSNEPRVAEKAADLYHQGLAPWVVFSGGIGHRWRDVAGTEAEMFAATAVARGVPESRIVIENRSTNTAENVTLSLPILDGLGIASRTVLLITIPPFQRRASLTLRTHRPAARCINAPISWGPLAALGDDKLRVVAELCAGEVFRLQDYPRRGFIDWDPAELPQEMREAAAVIGRLTRTASGTPN